MSTIEEINSLRARPNLDESQFRRLASLTGAIIGDLPDADMTSDSGTRQWRGMTVRSHLQAATRHRIGRVPCHR